MARKTDKSRPMIWAEGRQHPKLDPKSFALASVGFAREGLQGLLERCAASAGAGLTSLDAPKAGRLDRLVRGTGRVLDQAARWVGGRDAVPPETIFRPADAAPRPVTEATRQAQAHSMPLDPDLALLRTVISEARASARTGAAGTRAERKAVAAEARAQAPKRRLVSRMAGAMLGFGLLVVSVPYGMVRAVLAHMNGQDLRREA